jgi:REP element-mobilizing transposase RayT
VWIKIHTTVAVWNLFHEDSAMWNLPAPPGFQGFRDDLLLTCYQQLLPHWRQDGATYAVTFRLADSLPQAKLEELCAFKAEWLRRNPPLRANAVADALSQAMMERVEAWLDQGMGDCVLRSSSLREPLIASMRASDGKTCELGAFVVMPNQVHAIVRPLDPRRVALEIVLKHWKGVSASEINRTLHRTAALWQRESFDRLIRDEEHLWRALQYLGRNPHKA